MCLSQENDERRYETRNGKDFDKYETQQRKKNYDAVNRLCEIGKERQEVEKKLRQAQHRKQRLENKMEYLSKKRFNNQKARNHRLIHKGIAIECVDKNTELLTETEFYELAEEVFGDSSVKERVARIVNGRREAVEEAEMIFEIAEQKKG